MTMLFLHQLMLIAALTGAAFAFGVVLQLGDLLQRHGYRWFRGAPLVVGVAAAGLGVGMLWLAQPILHILWLAVVAGWVARGRIAAPTRALTAAALLAMIFVCGPRIGHYPGVALYFFGVLIPLGLIHGLARRTKHSARIAWLLEREHLVWYAMAAGYCFFFELDPKLCLGVYGFVHGQRYLDDETRRARLRSWGIRKRPGAE